MPLKLYIISTDAGRTDSYDVYLSAFVAAADETAARYTHPDGYHQFKPGVGWVKKNGEVVSDNVIDRQWTADPARGEVRHVGEAGPDLRPCVLLSQTRDG